MLQLHVTLARRVRCVHSRAHAEQGPITPRLPQNGTAPGPAHLQITVCHSPSPSQVYSCARSLPMLLLLERPPVISTGNAWPVRHRPLRGVCTRSVAAAFTPPSPPFLSARIPFSTKCLHLYQSPFSTMATAVANPIDLNDKNYQSYVTKADR